MQCQQAQNSIHQALQQGLSTEDQRALTGHLATCDECRDKAENAQLSQLLDSLPKVRMRAGFAEEALDKAWAAREAKASAQPNSRVQWWVASAASVVLAVGIVFSMMSTRQTPGVAPSDTMEVVALEVQKLREVDLLMVSGRDLPSANITVSIDDNLRLEGYPNQNQLRWKTSIRMGNNQLSLPLRMHSGSDGIVVVEVESNGARKQMRFAVTSDSREGRLI